MQSINESKKQTKRWYKKTWGMLLIAFIVLYFGSALIVRFTTDPSAKENPKPTVTETTPPTQTAKPQTPSYEIKIAGNEYSGRTTRMVTFTVKNTGNKESNPACTVNLRDESGTYTGYDYLTWNTPLAPGETKYFEGQIVITNEGAEYATKSNVSCVERQY
jgi:hypothetical protein